MRISTYNLLHGRPVSGPTEHAKSGTDPEVSGDYAAGLAAAVKSLDPDLIGMQEVDVDQPRSGNVHEPKVVAEALGTKEWRFTPTVMGTPNGFSGFRSTTVEEREQEVAGTLTGVRYGVAMVSRQPVLSWHTEAFAPASVALPLLVQTDGKPKLMRVHDEQRAAIAAVLETSVGPLTVATAHLSFVPGWNVKQLRQIKAWLEPLPRPLILMGDFNLPWPVPASVTRWTPLFREPTYPSYRPRVQFDHMLADGMNLEMIEEIKSNSQAVYTGVSDHCAVVADLPL